MENNLSFAVEMIKKRCLPASITELGRHVELSAVKNEIY